MKTITLKFIVPDEDEKMANKVVQNTLEDTGLNTFLYNWTSIESTVREIKFYERKKRD